MFKYLKIVYLLNAGIYFHFLSFSYRKRSLQVYGFTPSLQNLSENQCQNVCKGDPRGNMCPSPNLPLRTLGTEKAQQQCPRIEQCCRASCCGDGRPHLDVELFVVQRSLQLQEAPLEGPQLYSQLLSLLLRVSLALQEQVLIVD